MQSSSSVIKNYNIDLEGDSIVDTKYESPQRNIEISRNYVEDNNNNQLIKGMEANIIKKATKRAERIQEESIITAENYHKEAYDKGYKEGYEKSYTLGYKDALDEAKSEKEKIINEGQEILNSCKIKYERYFREHEKKILECIVDIAEKVLQDELRDTSVVSNMVKHEIDKISQSKTIIIKLNPINYDEVNNNIEKWKHQYVLDNIFVVACDDINYDEVIIDKDNGKVKISVSYALEKIKSQLLK